MVNAVMALGNWLSSWLAAAVDLARRKPAKVLLWVLGFHLVVWTILPILVCLNLQLDLVEGLALGKEWQLGYWKHPPLPWWAADLIYRIVGQVDAVYVLGPLAVVVCFYAVWLLAREVTGELEALVVVLALEAIHFYNFSAVKFAHDQMQLPFWALTGLFFYRAIKRERALDWLLAGVFLALAFWSKYAAFALVATLGLFLLFDPNALRAWRTPGPWLMALAFLVVIAPNLWWLVDSGFMPLRYVDARAVAAADWLQYVSFPLRWTGSQMLFILPAIGLITLLFAGAQRGEPCRPDVQAVFARRYVTTLALGPFLVTTLVAAMLGRLPVALWGYPLWSFAPLAAILWLGPISNPRRLRWFAAAFIAVLLLVPVAYGVSELFDSFISDRQRATKFPGRLLAETVTRQWRERTGTPLRYVGGADVGSGAGEFSANNVAAYSPDRPHVVVHGQPQLSPWIDMADLDRRGAVFVWEQTATAPTLPDDLRARFPRAEALPPLVLPLQSRTPGRSAIIGYAILPPRP
jgi:4-amino-4-deoxy-L-arabinose transferase-like glycosyltransferase